MNGRGQVSWAHLLCGLQWIDENAERLNIKVSAMQAVKRQRQRTLSSSLLALLLAVRLAAQPSSLSRPEQGSRGQITRPRLCTVHVERVLALALLSAAACQLVSAKSRHQAVQSKLHTSITTGVRTCHCHCVFAHHVSQSHLLPLTLLCRQSGCRPVLFCGGRSRDTSSHGPLRMSQSAAQKPALLFPHLAHDSLRLVIE